MSNCTDLETIPETILEKLHSLEGKDSVAGRRAEIQKLAVALQRGSENLPRLSSRNAWFSTTQTDAKSAAGKIRVQLLGIEIAELNLDSTRGENHCYKFRPKPSIIKKVGWSEEVGPWKWSHNKKDAERINRFLKVCEKHPAAKPDNEREIQWQLAKALRSDKTGALRRLQPVTWNGLFTEVGVSITRSGELGKTKPGTIDLVVRRDRGFLVFEIKKPGDKKIEDALIQASRYAAALSIEANEGGDENLKNYRVVFRAQGKEKLNIGAVAVLEDDEAGEVRKKANEILPKYCVKGDHQRIDRIGVLLYKFDKEKRVVASWKWLAGWDARNAIPRTVCAV